MNNLHIVMILIAVACFIIAVICAAVPTTVGVGAQGWTSSGLLASTIAAVRIQWQR